MSIVIVTDSASNLYPIQLNEYDIKCVPFKFEFNGEYRSCYDEGMDIEEESKKFYDAMRGGAVAHTSLISPGQFEEEFEKHIKQGNDVICIPLSSGLSGTYNAAKLAADNINMDYPSRKCVVIDSLSASFGQGLLCILASELRSEGKSIDEIEQIINEKKFKLCQELTVDDLKYLKRTGRVSNATAIVAGLLNIKPVMKGNNEGQIIVTGKALGKRMSLKSLCNHLKDKIVNPEKQVIYIAHCDAEKDANILAKMVKEVVRVKDVFIGFYDLCTGSHVGPGTVAMFYMGDKR